MSRFVCDDGTAIVIAARTFVDYCAIFLDAAAVVIGAVVGAGSVVTRSLPAGFLCLGSPCRPVRPLSGG